MYLLLMIIHNCRFDLRSFVVLYKQYLEMNDLKENYGMVK